MNFQREFSAGQDITQIWQQLWFWLGKEMKELVRVADHSRHLRKCREKAALIVRVEELVGWRRLWDECVQESTPGGVTGTLEAQSHHGRGSKS